MNTVAVLPVKPFPLAKQRLAESVAGALRLELARAMVGDVLSALRDCQAVATTIVVTGERSVAAAARYLGATVVDEAAYDGQSAAAALGIARALADGAERVVCVPGDCPALDPRELDLLLADDRAGVTIVPDRHGSGTNGLVLAPPGAIAPSFGPDSRSRHERLAAAAGVAWRVARPPSLLLDIDTGEDLAALRERLAGESALAPRTRAVLGVRRATDRGAAAGARPAIAQAAPPV